MFLIDGNYFELVLEDGDIAVLSNIMTGESLTMDIKELLELCSLRRCSVCWKIKKSVATTTSSTDNKPIF